MSRLRIDQHGNYDLHQIAEVVKRCGEQAPERLQVVKWYDMAVAEAARLAIDMENMIRHNQMYAAAALKVNAPRFSVSELVVPNGALGQAIQIERKRRFDSQMLAIAEAEQKQRERIEQRRQAEAANAEPAL